MTTALSTAAADSKDFHRDGGRQHRLASWDSAWNRSVLLLLLTVAICFQTWSDLWPYWEHKNATYTHGTLIAAVAVWLVWRARSELSRVAPVPNLALLPVILLLSVAWTLAARGNVFIIHAMLWPPLAFAVLWAGVGWRAASKLAFPLGVLYAAIPFWDYFKPPLQALAASIVGVLTGVAGVPAHIEGPYVHLPHSTIFITLECSGVHFLSVALAIGALAIKFRGDGVRTGIIILLLAASLSTIFNWLRIFLIVLAYLDPRSTRAMETMGHLTFGWWVFAFDIVAFYLVLRLIPSSRPSAAAEQGLPQELPATPATNNVTGFVLAAGAALLLPLSSLLAHALGDYPPVRNSAPPALRGLTGPLSPDPLWQPRFNGASSTHRAAYVKSSGRVIELYRNEYHQQSQDSELIAHDQQLFDQAVFTPIASSVLQLDGLDKPLDVTRLQLKDRSGREWMALYAYSVGEKPVASASKAQLLTAFRSIYGHPVAGILAIAMPCAPDCSTISRDLSEAMMAAEEAYRRPRE